MVYEYLYGYRTFTEHQDDVSLELLGSLWALFSVLSHCCFYSLAMIKYKHKIKIKDTK